MKKFIKARDAFAMYLKTFIGVLGIIQAICLYLAWTV